MNPITCLQLQHGDLKPPILYSELSIHLQSYLGYKYMHTSLRYKIVLLFKTKFKLLLLKPCTDNFD